jgi:hypothetical protein
MIFDIQHSLLSLNACLLKHDLQVSLEFLHRVLTVDVWREEAHVEQV